jgi:hypothetical protein
METPASGDPGRRSVHRTGLEEGIVDVRRDALMYLVEKRLGVSEHVRALAFAA